MKITKQQLTKIIKEELQKFLKEEESDTPDGEGNNEEEDFSTIDVFKMSPKEVAMLINVNERKKEKKLSSEKFAELKEKLSPEELAELKEKLVNFIKQEIPRLDGMLDLDIEMLRHLASDALKGGVYYLIRSLTQARALRDVLMQAERNEPYDKNRKLTLDKDFKGWVEEDFDKYIKLLKRATNQP